MPVIRIAALPQPALADVQPLLARLCLALAEIDRAEPRHWWAVWQTIAPGSYTEGGVSAPATQPSASHPPLVDIQAFTGRQTAVIERLLDATAAILADGLGIEPGNVFVTWTELEPGRVFTGGEIRR